MLANRVVSTQEGSLDPFPSLLQTSDIQDIDRGTAEDGRLGTAPGHFLKISRTIEAMKITRKLWREENRRTRRKPRKKDEHQQ